MAKTRAKKTSPAENEPAPAAELRAKLAELDRRFAGLMQERAQLVVALAGQGQPAYTVTRLPEAEGPLPARSVEAVFRELTSGCRALVHRQRIAYLGPEYSYSHLAAIHRFGQGVEFVPVGTISAVFEEVHQGQSEFGLVPIENSTDGRISDTLEMFTHVPVRICGEVEMRIHHTLLGKCPRSDIREVYSKPQALSQCRNWLARHLPGARTIEVTSTSTAAKLALEKPGAAAIASLQAGIHYGLDALAEAIEDNPANTTRFAVIGKETSPRTGKDRTAMLFQTEHRPGALAEVMNVFKRSRVNLTWIESFPLPGPERIYLFFAEMEGHQDDTRFRRALGALSRKTLRLEVLGSYPAGEPVG